MKRTLLILTCLAILAQLTGAIVIRALFGIGTFWGIEVLTLVILIVYGGICYWIFQEPQIQTDTSETFLKGLRETMIEGVTRIKDVSSAVEQIAVIHSGAINAVEKVSDRLKKFSPEMFRPVNGDIHGKLDKTKFAIDSLIESVFQVKRSLEEVDSLLNEQTDSLTKQAPKEIDVIREKSKLQTLLGVLDDSIQKIGVNMTKLNSAAKETRSMILELQQRVKKGFEGDFEELRRLLDEVESLLEEQISSIGVLKDSEQFMGRLLESLQRVTSKARLLSINAQVAAVQQGQEQSFTVLAEEILSLSEEAAEATRQMDRAVHESMAKIEGTTDDSKSILSIIKAISKSLEKLVNRVDEVNSEIEKISKEYNSLVYDTTSEADTLAEMNEATEEMQTILNRVFDKLSEEYYLISKKLESLKTIIEKGSPMRESLSVAVEAIQDCYTKAIEIKEALENLDDHIQKIENEQSTKCNAVGAVIEETIVAFEQLKHIDEHLRVLEEETREAQRLLERALR